MERRLFSYEVRANSVDIPEWHGGVAKGTLESGAGRISRIQHQEPPIRLLTQATRSHD